MLFLLTAALLPQVAVHKSLAERTATGVRVQQLENFTAEGKPVADPEDDKLWLSMESKHRLLEFDFVRTWEQVRAFVWCCIVSAAAGRSQT